MIKSGVKTVVGCILNKRNMNYDVYLDNDNVYSVALSDGKRFKVGTKVLEFYNEYGNREDRVRAWGIFPVKVDLIAGKMTEIDGFGQDPYGRPLTQEDFDAFRYERNHSKSAEEVRKHLKIERKTKRKTKRKVK